MRLFIIIGALLLGFTQAAAAQEGLGLRLYRASCAGCHGPEAHGDGWLAQYLTRPPARLTTLKQRYGEFPREKVIAMIDGREEVKLHGPRDMPVWGEQFAATLVSRDEGARRRINALADYLATIQE